VEGQLHLDCKQQANLEDALRWVRWTIHGRWRETNEYGTESQYIHDAETAVITNRNTGYRWILRRSQHVVEFQTPKMLEETIAAASKRPRRWLVRRRPPRPATSEQEGSRSRRSIRSVSCVDRYGSGFVSATPSSTL
jgi:hypothetical protein